MAAVSRISLCCSLVVAITLSALTSVQAQTVVTSIRVKSLNAIAADLNNVTAHLGAPPVGSMAVSFLTGLAGASTGAGLNLDKAAFAYVLLADPSGANGGAAGGMSPMMTPPTLVMVLPVSGDGSGFMNALNGSFMSQAKDGALTLFTEPSAPMPGFRSRLYVGREAGYAVVGDNAAATAKVFARLREKVPAAPDSTFSATIGVQSLLPILESGIAMGKMAAASRPASASSSAAAGPVDTTKVVGAELDLLLVLLQQIETFNIRLSAGALAIDVATYATLMPDSLLARLQSNFRPVSDRYKSLVPPGAYVSLAGNGMQLFSEHMDDYMALIKPVMDAVGSMDSNMAGVVESQLALCKDLYSGDWSFAVVPSSGETKLGVMEFVGVKNATQAREAMLKGALGTRIPGSGSMASMDVAVEEQARTYQGHDIMKISYGKDAIAADPQMASAMATMPVIGMFMSTEVAFVDDLAIITWGGPEVMETAINLATTGNGVRIDKTAPFVTLFPSAEGEPVSLLTLQLLNLIKSVAQMDPQGMGASFAADIQDTDSGIAGYSYMMDDKHVSVVRIGYDELAGFSKLATSARKTSTTFIPGGMDMESDGSMPVPMDGMGTSSVAVDPQTACLNNLRMIDAAKELYGMESSLTEGAEVPVEGLSKFMPGGLLPTCPLGNNYIIGSVGVSPSCAAEGHVLP